MGDPLEAARKRAGMSEMQGLESAGYIQDELPGMEYCEFEYGEPDDILSPSAHAGKNWCGPCNGWINGEPCDE